MPHSGQTNVTARTCQVPLCLVRNVPDDGEQNGARRRSVRPIRSGLAGTVRDRPDARHGQPQRRPRHHARRARPGPHRRAPRPAARLRRRHPRSHPAPLPETPGQIITTSDTITIRLERRAYAPVLRKASLPEGTRIPWLGNRAIHYELS